MLRRRPSIYVGTSLVLHNPLIRAERLITRAIAEADVAARLSATRRELESKRALQRIILQREITTFVSAHLGHEPKDAPRVRGALPRSGRERAPKPGRVVSSSPVSRICSSSSTNSAAASRFRPQARVDCRESTSSSSIPCRSPSEIRVFQGKDLIDLFEGIDIAPEQIVLEVTESHAIDNFPLFVGAMKDFMDLRCLVAIDDMGAGHSGLDKIVHLRPNYVKLDMSLIRDIDTSFVKQQLVQTFKSLADKIDARLVAEGVETPGELEVLQRIGVRYIQGFLLAKPSQAFQTASSYPL